MVEGEVEAVVELGVEEMAEEEVEAEGEVECYQNNLLTRKWRSVVDRGIFLVDSGP
jgi:hypothetical protein